MKPVLGFAAAAAVGLLALWLPLPGPSPWVEQCGRAPGRERVDRPGPLPATADRGPAVGPTAAAGAGPGPHAPAPAPAAVPARAPAAAPAAAPATRTRIRVVVQLAGDVGASTRPVAELLRLDRHGQPWPVAGLGRDRRHPALTLAGGAAPGPQARAATRVFEVTGPGRYVAAWHVWSRVPGTRTWRACRGQGPGLVLAGGEGERELVVQIRAADLHLDPRLDAPAPDAHTTLTAKDG